jgi:hypothetical protein
MKTKQLLLPILLLAFIMLTANCCEKDDEPSQLPPITQTGEETFGCMINGELWLPHGSFPSPATWVKLSVESTKLPYRFWQIETGQGAASSTGFHITENIMKEGTIPLLDKSTENKDSVIYAWHYSKTLGVEPGKNLFEVESIESGELTITKLDTINRIISGTFYFDAYNPDGLKVEVREGRFDLKIDVIENYPD